ncbi:ribosomal protein S9/S16-domain-containing protein [Syncephalis pseudoplumigaleata]|uniref:Small ribosomal subunit protein uS9m n=1 Tax=Syncephalis pseudoplumigaleata TaxID=1712513 RepID=A0A4P9Z794_9FUNG|nr:ribosomal protein S9/S16-domain-containing protein [Syncephalis pseudoplumigaleata]|eukprot:RKP28062.1 ribosomal protein S9/S16-domain-containing protein [Syncephalis pseudoplumigaleata]
MRARPTSPAYFTGQPIYNDLLANLDQLWADTRQQLAASMAYRPSTTSSASSSSTADVTETVNAGWLSRERMSQFLGVDLTTTQYRRVVEKLNRVWRQPGLAEHMPQVLPELAGFRRPDTDRKQQTVTHTVDRFGRAFAYGWRKEASARVWLVHAAEDAMGEVMINGKPLATYFVRMEDRESVVKPLMLTGHLGRFNVWGLVHGGGTTGQAEAIRLAVARALLIHEPDLKPALRHAGLISHDARVVERKKPGQAKARKKYTWVKR